MTGDRRARLRGRRGHLAAVRHVQPAEVLEAAQAPDVTEDLAGLPIPDSLTGRPLPTLPPTPEEAAAEQAALDWPVADVSRETSAEPAPPLRAAQVARLEALTALWTRAVRLDAPADATVVWSAPRPPVPPSRPRPEETPPVPTAEEEAAAETPAPAPSPVPGGQGPARRVSAWTSRHDPASLAYAVRDRLGRRVPITDRLLERGPILDQGTTPPLDLRTASACTGMAAAAAANVLERSTTPAHATPAWRLEDDARRLYFRAQDLDQVHGHDYAGTSVLAAMKAGQEFGWWESYFWGLSTSDIAQVLLQWGVAVVVGVPWGPSLEAPDAAGVIAPTRTDGTGHALAVVGIRRQAPDGRPGPWFVLQQSRGTAEGLGGLVLVHHLHLGRMLAGVGEAAVPLTTWNLQGLGL